MARLEDLERGHPKVAFVFDLFKLFFSQTTEELIWLIRKSGNLPKTWKLLVGDARAIALRDDLLDALTHLLYFRSDLCFTFGKNFLKLIFVSDVTVFANLVEC